MLRKTIPLRVILVSTFVLQTAAAVSLTMWLAWNNEQRSLEERHQAEQAKTLTRISDKLNEYFEFSAVINRLNRADLTPQGLRSKSTCTAILETAKFIDYRTHYSNLLWRCKWRIYWIEFSRRSHLANQSG
jgi:hypothetical protein